MPRGEVGETFGDLVVLAEAEPDRKASATHRGGWQTYRTVLVRCRCGAEKVVRVATLVKGQARSCGEGACWHRARGRRAPDTRRKRERGPDAADLRRRA